MPAPETIVRLVAKFEANREAYRSGKYNEAQLRLEFLDPFFEALGWDVHNHAGVAPDYREVLIEQSTEIEGGAKKPDYTFRIGQAPKFYVEAKKPKVDIQSDFHPAYQLKRYAWNKRLPLSILTDFEELALYNCRSKPNPGDPAATGRDKFYRYTEYIEKWDELAGIFSREAVWKGGFDRFAESTRGKKGTTEVDDAILEDIEGWRLVLARNIALRNPQVADEAQLNYAVQMTIDRILFLRICEDRGIEPAEQLLEIAKTTDIYAGLVGLFRRADQKFNSGLFHFSAEKDNDSAPDSFTPGLSIDDRVLKDIIKSLYYPCPYIFNALPVEILGQVYEQFLGKVIRLTAGHQAKIEEKPEVRKAGGVYYTPQYIVDYIVQNTVGRLLEGKTPEEAAELKIVDPACGSGSFLLGAYQYLLDWHLKWYLEHEPEQWGRAKNPPVLPAAGGAWKLTTRKRKEILVNSIHGVDIDAQAVEVTKLSLLLKVLEEESGQLSLGLERALPDLGRNIQCGNSLIGEDYFAGKLMVDEAERRRVNPFEWRVAFAQVFARGGFDAVIGNPPYINSILLEQILAPEIKPYWKMKYETASGAYDIYILFIENGIKILRNDGILSFIIPNKFLAAEYAIEFRDWVYKQIHLASILDLSRVKVWPISVYPVIPVFQKKKPTSDSLLRIFNGSFDNKSEITEINQLNYQMLGRTPDKIWSFITQKGADLLLRLVNNSKTLEDVAEVVGASTVAEGSEYPRLIFEGETKEKEAARFIVSGNILRYEVTWNSSPVQFTHKKYIKPYILLKSPMPKRRIEQARQQKIIICKVGLEPRGYLDITGEYVGAYTTYIFSEKLSLFYILGLLNSTLMSFLYRNLYDALAMGGGYLRFQPPQVKRLPIYIVDSLNTSEEKKYSLLVALVERMLALHQRALATPQEAERVKREIAATDREIDALVYALYGLTEEEIRLVEGGG